MAKIKGIEEMSYEELMALAKAKKAEESVAKIENVTFERKGNALVITVQDVTKVTGDSKSGKSHMIASTRGFVDIGNGLTLGLNLTKKK